MERRHLASVVVSDCIQFKSGRLVYIGFYIWGNLQSPKPPADLGAGNIVRYWHVESHRANSSSILLGCSFHNHPSQFRIG